MCGIAGYIRRNRDIEERMVKDMCNMIRHRGPDDEGLFVQGPVGLGMRRLSIIDIAGGHQPIFNEQGTMCTVFNGEIYNYKELRSSLLAQGHEFSTRTDTEVLVHQYEKSGRDCVSALNGMFAFAIWDELQQRLFIARDRMGIKPLYYYFDGERFLFASEIKSLLVEDCIKPQLNENGLWDYLTFRYVPEPETIWKGIRKLPPAHWLMLNTRSWNLTVERYWDIPYPHGEPSACADESQMAEEFGGVFEDSVARHLQADVPVGILLSGGLDSSAVLAAVSRLHTDKIFSFSVAFKDGGEFDELNYARQAARHADAQNYEVVIDHNDFMDFLPEFVWHTDEPLADLASVPLYYVSKLAREHVKVVLSGEGSDEILGGYDLELFMREVQRAGRLSRFPAFIRNALCGTILSKESGIDPVDIPSHRAFHMTNIFSHEEKRRLFQTTPAAAGDSIKLIREYYNRVKGSNPLNQVLYTFSQSWLVEDLLMKADKMTMANSIELRVPFLDHRIVEWAAKAPPSMKIGMLNNKLVTKKVLRMYANAKVPESIISRPKKGFPVPAYGWLSGELKSFAMDILGAGSRSAGLFDRKLLSSYVHNGTRSEAGVMDRHKLWSLLILELWMRRWLR